MMSLTLIFARAMKRKILVRQTLDLVSYDVAVKGWCIKDLQASEQEHADEGNLASLVNLELPHHRDG